MFKKLNITGNSFFRYFFPYKEKKIFYFHRFYHKNKILYIIFQNIFTLTIINWIFQGILYMDKGERYYHILVELFILFILLFIFNINFYIALIISHTLNWILNSHFWTFVRFLNIPINSRSKTKKYLYKLKSRVSSVNCFDEVLIIGGISRGKQKFRSSDIDIRFIRKNGILNWLYANLFVTKEKIYCFFRMIPLDAYVFDSIAVAYAKTNANEEPISILSESFSI